MPEFRQNIATKEWVIIASERAKRPKDFAREKKKKKTLPEHVDDCPFCPGNEDMTPPAVLTIEADKGWAVRVVPNKFAALKSDLSPDRRREGRFVCAEGFGVAEVIIETPDHSGTIGTMERSEVLNVLSAYRTRYLEIARDERINLITVFRNHGERAGTSLVHPHSQVIATPIVPPHVRDQITQAHVCYDTYGTCIYCEMIQEELTDGERIILDTDAFVVLAPYASRSPFETRILPKQHASSFGSISQGQMKHLAEVLQTTMGKVYRGLGNPDYNYIIRSAPTGDVNGRHYHWYIVIIPRLATPAGFEMGSGIYINSVTPESCAEFLRDV